MIGRSKHIIAVGVLMLCNAALCGLVTGADGDKPKRLERFSLLRSAPRTLARADAQSEKQEFWFDKRKTKKTDALAEKVTELTERVAEMERAMAAQSEKLREIQQAVADLRKLGDTKIRTVPEAPRRGVIEAAEFVLRDSAGNVRGKWYIQKERNAVVFELYHKDGKQEAIQLWVQPGPLPGMSESAIHVTSDDGWALSSMDVSGGSPNIATVDNNGRLIWRTPTK